MVYKSIEPNKEGNMNRLIGLLVLFFMPVLALAQEAGEAVKEVATKVAEVVPAPPVGDVQLDGLIKMIVDLFGSFDGFVNWQLKAAAIIVILIAAWRVSALSFLWDKLGSAKAWLAPLLSLIAAIFTTWGSGLAAGSWEWTISNIFLTLTTGAAAMAIANLLKSVKAIPGLGSVWVSVIEVLEKLLGKKKQS